MSNRRTTFIVLATSLLVSAVATVPGARALAAVPSEGPHARTIPFTKATATQNADGFQVAWVSPGAGVVRVFAGTDPDAIGRAHPVGKGPATGSLAVTGLPAEPRWYFELVPTKGRSLVIADRFLHLASAPNFRDVGGYRTSDGHWVKMGELYRSEALSKLTSADYTTVEQLGIKLVCDLRTEYERTKDPDPAFGSAQNVVFDVAGDSDKTKQYTEAVTSGDPALQQALLGDGKAAQLLIDGSRGFVSSTTAKAAYHSMFTRLADPSSLPGLLHCSAGKDRTGWAAAAMLTLLGVPRATVEQDYLLSNDALKAGNERTLSITANLISRDLLEPLITVQPQYLAASFSEVKKVYGTFDNYVKRGLGLKAKAVAELRQQLLAG